MRTLFQNDTKILGLRNYGLTVLERKSTLTGVIKNLLGTS